MPKANTNTNKPTNTNTNKPTKPTSGRSAAPATDAPAPESVTQSARAKRLATVQSLISAGAHKPNVRSTTTVRIPLYLTKYDFSHLAKKSLAERVSGVTPGTADFYRANVKAFAGKTVSAAQFDNAKLARCISAGLCTASGGNRDGQHLCGDVQITFATK